MMIVLKKVVQNYKTVVPNIGSSIYYIIFTNN